VSETVAARVAQDEPGPGFVAKIRYIRRHRMWTPRYWAYAVRYLWRFKILSRHIRTGGMVFLARGAKVYCRRGLGRMEIGRSVWIGEGCALRCHEGSFRLGDRVVMGGYNTLHAYLDLDVGEDCIFADWIYVTDFDHRYRNVDTPIQKQGLVYSPVRIGRDCWVGTKVSVLRGASVGEGSVLGAHAVVRGDVPAYSVAVGAPARVVKRRGDL
jgi:acetyltransferase-like isoleucine patch superfamily enzyme